jgi:hypothetical protein
MTFNGASQKTVGVIVIESPADKKLPDSHRRIEHIP